MAVLPEDIRPNKKNIPIIMYMFIMFYPGNNTIISTHTVYIKKPIIKKGFRPYLSAIFGIKVAPIVHPANKSIPHALSMNFDAHVKSYPVTQLFNV